MSAQAKLRAPIQKVTRKLRELRKNHEERHRPSGFQFAFADRIDFLNSDAWERATAGQSLFLRRETLRVIERSGPSNLVPRYALMFENDEPVAALAAQCVTVTPGHFLKETDPAEGNLKSGLLRRALAPAADAVKERLNLKMLVAGNLMSWGFHGIAFAPGTDRERMWPGLAEALYRIRRAERLDGDASLVLIKDFTPQETGCAALRRFSYQSMETEPNMVLSIDPAWRSYDDYLQALDAKYRRNSKDQIKKLANAGCTVEVLTDVASNAARLHELYLSVHKNAAVKLVTLPESFLPEMAKALGPDFICTVVRRGEEILGFVSALRDGDTAIAYYIGFDRDAAAAGLPIYLRLLHSTIATAIGWRCRSLSLGRTALEPKSALGAKPEPLSVWCRHRVPAFNWALHGILSGVTHDEAPERNPFKRTPSESATEG